MIGNGYGLPDGASRLIVNFFGPETLTSLTIDGQVLSNVAKPEAGWTGYRTDVVLPCRRVGHLRSPFRPRSGGTRRTERRTGGMGSTIGDSEPMNKVAGICPVVDTSGPIR